MKADHDRVRLLLQETITLLCRNGLLYESELKVEGVLGITVDKHQVFIVHLNETLVYPQVDTDLSTKPTVECIRPITPLLEACSFSSQSHSPYDDPKQILLEKRESQDTESKVAAVKRERLEVDQLPPISLSLQSYNDRRLNLPNGHDVDNQRLQDFDLNLDDNINICTVKRESSEDRVEDVTLIASDDSNSSPLLSANAFIPETTGAGCSNLPSVKLNKGFRRANPGSHPGGMYQSKPAYHSVGSSGHFSKGQGGQFGGFRPKSRGRLQTMARFQHDGFDKPSALSNSGKRPRHMTNFVDAEYVTDDLRNGYLCSSSTVDGLTGWGSNTTHEQPVDERMTFDSSMDDGRYRVGEVHRFLDNDVEMPGLKDPRLSVSDYR